MICRAAFPIAKKWSSETVKFEKKDVNELGTSNQYSKTFDGGIMAALTFAIAKAVTPGYILQIKEKMNIVFRALEGTERSCCAVGLFLGSESLEYSKLSYLKEIGLVFSKTFNCRLTIHVPKSMLGSSSLSNTNQFESFEFVPTGSIPQTHHIIVLGERIEAGKSKQTFKIAFHQSLSQTKSIEFMKVDLAKGRVEQIDQEEFMLGDAKITRHPETSLVRSILTSLGLSKCPESLASYLEYKKLSNVKKDLESISNQLGIRIMHMDLDKIQKIEVLLPSRSTLVQSQNAPCRMFTP